MSKMKPKLVLGVIIILGLLLALSAFLLAAYNRDLLSRPTATPTKPYLATGSTVAPASPTPTATFMVVCTPPLCAIGTSEIYYCPGSCPGGCGTTCATFTPTP